MILLIYLIKVTICSILFFGYYFLVLRNKHFHQYNRYYILISTVLSVVLPLISIPVAFYAQNSSDSLTKALTTITLGGWEDEFVVTAQTTFLGRLITSESIFVCIYVIGLLFFLIPVIKTFTLIARISKDYESEVVSNIRFYNTVEPGTPFSFFDTIYWNSAIPLNSKEGQYILRHELFHIRTKHTYDIVLMQFICCLFWFIPFFYLMKAELQVIHEFLADKYAAPEIEKHQYAELLVMQALSTKEIGISNQFFFNQIKRRITMILKQNQTRYAYIRKAMALPFVLLMLCACSSKSKIEMPPKVENSNVVFTKVETEASFAGGQDGWIRFLNQTFKYPREAQDKEIQGTVIIQFIVERDGSLTDIHAVSGPAVLSNEAARLLAESGKWIPARQNGQVVRSFRKQPITFRLERE